MPEFQDLTGQKFGHLRVIERGENAKGGRVRWLCRCECGECGGVEGLVQANNLKSGISTSCGSVKRAKAREQRDDLTGQKFGHWLVLERGENNKHGHARWLCRCECGECGGVEKLVRARSLKSGHSTSCGSVRRAKAREQLEDLTGQRFGHWRVMEQGENSEHGGTRWLCRCECDECGGVEKLVHARNLKRGHSTSCGSVKRAKLRAIRGPRNPSYKTGRYKTRQGYIRLSGYQDHPNGRASGEILEHVLVMAEHIGRPLLPSETVHHKNGIRDDNRIENLELWDTSHPPGQRVEDKLKFYREFIRRYEGTPGLETSWRGHKIKGWTHAHESCCR